MIPKVVQVVPTEEFTVYVYFEDGKIVFMNTCTVMNDTLAWDVSGNRDNSACIDIDPDTLYALNAVKEKIA